MRLEPTTGNNRCPQQVALRSGRLAIASVVAAVDAAVTVAAASLLATRDPNRNASIKWLGRQINEEEEFDCVCWQPFAVVAAAVALPRPLLR